MAQCLDIVKLRFPQKEWTFLTHQGTVVFSRSLLLVIGFGSCENTNAGPSLSIEFDTK